jgi:anaerobic selenocysteine-containing dehydrogenase/Fe-S-cluster-containing dehydrogenase component
MMSALKRQMTDSLDRRNFLKLVGIGGIAGTVAGTAGCSDLPGGHHLVSPVTASERELTGLATWYATTCRECPAGCGMKVRTLEGRATKVEGNPEHPISQGGLCMRGQASLQGLYNPDRIRGPLRREASSVSAIPWEQATEPVATRLRDQVHSGGGKVAFLSGRNGDALDHLIRQWMKALGSERYLIHEPFSHAAIREANRIVFGKPALPVYDFSKVDYLLSFGADFLETWLSPVRFTRGYAAMRQVRDGTLAKIVQLEPRLSLTGANADEWVAIRPGTETEMVLAMAQHIVSAGLAAPLPGVRATAREWSTLLAPFSPDRVSASVGVPATTITRLAGEFAAASSSLAIGGGVAVSGEHATETQVAINLLNYLTGRVGNTVRFDQTLSEESPATVAELRDLVAAMHRKEVEVLFVHHANPVFALPPELGFAAALESVPMVVSFASFPDETTDRAHLVLPDHTPLEQWGDARAASSAHGLMQPAMNPVFDTRAAGDVLLELARRIGEPVAPKFTAQTLQEYLKDDWRAQYGSKAADFEAFWREALLRGGVWDSGADSAKQAAPELSLAVSKFTFSAAPAAPTGELALHLYPSSRYYDGRGANQPWLHEIPDPVTNVVWDSWIELHPETAAKLGVSEGDLMRVASEAGNLEAPVYLYAGVRPDTVAMPIGLGHSSYGRYAAGVGANPIALLPAKEDKHSGALAWSGVSVKLSKTGRRRELVRTDGSTTEEGRGLTRIVPLSALTGAADAPPKLNLAPDLVEYPDFYPPHKHKDYRWGLAINLNSCTGCGACVAACYAENNVPVVGKQRVAEGRHMAWIRIERYLENVSAAPDVRFSPMMCQQCDNAPCEPVCPVHATMHNSDGLNVQVYNRCVGTRYCSNNCPYKVRTFNWFDYEFPQPLELQLNPDVSVRGRGVMEKCTFCIQRIRSGESHAKGEGRKLRDGEVISACAQSCPAQAITFGNLLDPESAVSKLSQAQGSYKVFEELNTKPAITYLPRIKRT